MYGAYASAVLAAFAKPEVTPELDHLGSMFMAKYAEYVPVHGRDDVLQSFKKCFCFTDPLAASAMARRMPTIAPAVNWVDMHISLFADLRNLADSPQKTEALVPYLRTFFLVWMHKTVGRVGLTGRSPIQVQIERWRCSCHFCQAARAFVKEDPVKTWSITIPQAKKHDKNHLDSHLQRLMGFSAELEKDNHGSEGLRVSFYICLDDT